MPSSDMPEAPISRMQVVPLPQIKTGDYGEILGANRGKGMVCLVVSLNYCSQNGGNLYRAPYYNGNPNIGPRIIGNLDQYPM